MKFEELIVLLPCHSLEDFPTHHTGDEAEGLLSAWSALWHPALIACVNKLPTWYRADSPPEEMKDRLVVVPKSSEELLLAGWTSRAKTSGAHVIRKTHRRSEIVQAALAELDGGDGGVEADLAADFLALGVSYLLVELLTRQMRYMSNVDEIHLRNETVAAAGAAMSGQTETARQHLRNCFDTLTEARERFYAVNAYLVDLTLVASTTLGDRLKLELEGDAPINLLLSGKVLEEMAQQHPATLTALQYALDRGTVTIVGGEYTERAVPLLPFESIRAELQRGAEVYRRILGKGPTIYGRRRSGLTPVLPQVLSRTGFAGALHLTLDDGQFPSSDQSKTRWEGLDSSAIDALVRLPIDANATESFLGFPRRMGESMDTDHVATVIAAHWPGQSSPFYDDLRRMTRYAPVLGKFVTLENYFAHTDKPGSLTQFTVDQYRAPYLKQAIIREEHDPLSRTMDHYRRHYQAQSEQSLATLIELLGDKLPPDRVDLLNKAEQAAAVAESNSSDSASAADVAALDEQLDRRRTTTAASLAKILSAKSTGSEQGYLVLNPQSFPRRFVVDVSDLAQLPSVESPISAAQDVAGIKRAVVDVPGMGFAWIGAGNAAQKKTKPGKPLAEDKILRNEFMEVHIHPTTGGIKSIYDYASRGNRFSEQLAFRLPTPRPKPGDVWRDPDEDANYSVAACDSVEVVSAGPAVGEIVTRGRLLDLEGKKLAGFVQRFQLPRGSRMLSIDIELDIDQEPRADPWNSYYAARFAWSDEEAELWRSVSQTNQPTDAKRLEAPQWVEIRGDKHSTAILTGGLPYHRGMGLRKLDTLLVVRGERARKFKLGVGLDLPHPWQQAVDLLDPPVVVPRVPAPPAAARNGWLFNVDAKNVTATHWEPLHDEGKVVGFRVRLLETEGRPGRVQLRAFREVRSARQIDFAGQTLVELTVSGDTIPIDLTAYEWVEVEARF